MDIILDRFGWGDCEADDVTAVLASVTKEFSSVGVKVPETICIYPTEYNYPQVLTKRGPKDEHCVLLFARGRSWNSYAYEFSHELCHILTKHYDTQLHHCNRWLDEYICEVASHWCLNKLALTWNSNPPHQHWKEYAPRFTEKSEQKLNYITGPESSTVFKTWHKNQIESLRSDSIQREKNKIIARQLLPLFESNPDL